MAVENNDDRAQLAYGPLQVFADSAYGDEVDRDLTDPDAFEQACSDYLADLMHLADRSGDPSAPRGQVWQNCFGRAISHYQEEIAEEEAEPRPDLQVV